MKPPELYMVFDVESIGLHGEGFAVAWTVLNKHGKIIESESFACSPDEAYGLPESRAWVKDHVSVNNYNCQNPKQVRGEFWKAWKHYRSNEAVLVADCLWPVEARFVCACIDDEPKEREWEGPYPFHELASVLLALGQDPMAKRERKEDELPEHNPSRDSNQSARLLSEALKLIP